MRPVIVAVLVTLSVLTGTLTSRDTRHGEYLVLTLITQLLTSILTCNSELPMICRILSILLLFFEFSSNHCIKIKLWNNKNLAFSPTDGVILDILIGNIFQVLKLESCLIGSYLQSYILGRNYLTYLVDIWIIKYIISKGSTYIVLSFKQK